MTKSILILISLLLILAPHAAANSVSLELRITMPQVVSSTPEEKQDTNIITRQIQDRNGESVIVETTLAK